mgnify:CR=1 FL=1
MKKDLELAILELQKCLYPDNNQEIDNISLKIFEELISR